MLASKVNSTFTTVASLMRELFRGGWYFTGTPIISVVLPGIDNQVSPEASTLFDEIKGSIHIRKAVLLCRYS